ncbi:MAG TPA: DUF4301 family protein [Bacteroidales bacterium]|nr:DUF4301 family protein [Bacteroidales bacterium]
MLTKKDLRLLQENGISEISATEQIELLQKNDSYLLLVAPATPDKGITIVKDTEYFINTFEKEYLNHKICKFVPASGAATRMFKRLISFNQEASENNFVEGGFYSVHSSFNQLQKFAFFETLQNQIKQNKDYQYLSEKILFSGLGYAEIPKGLIEFHKYPNGSRTAFEEHLHEAAKLCKDNGKIDIHLTVSPEFKEDFENNLIKIREKTGLKLNVDFSIQEKSTDTLALYDDESPARDSEGNLLLRPGGHGALLKNLNRIDADIIFIKNIDNLTHGDYLEDTLPYKKLLGGMLIDIIQKNTQIFKNISSEEFSLHIDNAKKYLEERLGADFSQTKNLREEILRFINRPVRVCGMVKNTGEPGGGPFWVLNAYNTITLQIVEKAQVNLSLADQKDKFMSATHFNPVDLVCYTKSLDGKRFDLNNFVDKNACFISEKTHLGKNIRVLEHPGLWNGAMANWLTVFVEVPLITFNPVKELNDLLRKEHQPKEEFWKAT